MNAQNSISAHRLSLLLKREFFMNRWLWLLAISVFALITLLISVVSTYYNQSFSQSHFFIAGVIMLIAGYFFTSKIFDDLHDRIKALHYITLPASPAEKLIAGWLITGPGFMAVLLLTLVIVSMISSGIAVLHSNLAFQVYNPFAGGMEEMIFRYFIYHSMFFFGALYFKGYNFLKTVLAFIGFQTFFFTWIGILAWMFFGYFLGNLNATEETTSTMTFSFSLLSTGSYNNPEETIPTMNFISPLPESVKFILGIAVIMFFLFLSYIRYNEREA